MSFDATPSAISPFISELFDQSQPRRALSVLGWGVALGAHLLAAGLALTDHGQNASRTPPPLEVELVPPAPPPIPAPVPPALPVTEPEHANLGKSVPAAAAPPAPARAGALLTAKSDPTPSPHSEEPVDFTNDPGALGFGSGVVAVGGKAEVGAPHAQPSPAESPTGTRGTASRALGDALTPVSDLSQKPALDEPDPCRGYFPAGAVDDVASAAVLVTIGRSGAVSNVQLLSESPSKQGFGSAARTCIASKHFRPGLDRDGKPTATAIRVNIRFTR